MWWLFKGIMDILELLRLDLFVLKNLGSSIFLLLFFLKMINLVKYILGYVFIVFFMYLYWFELVLLLGKVSFLIDVDKVL